MIHEGAKIGKRVTLDGVDTMTIYQNVEIGDGSMLMAGCYLPPGVRLGRDVFIGPHVVFTNDKHPIAHNDAWVCLPTFVGDGASIGANATILPGVRIGARAKIGAGAVVTKDVPDGATVVGNPARQI